MRDREREIELEVIKKKESNLHIYHIQTNKHYMNTNIHTDFTYQHKQFSIFWSSIQKILLKLQVVLWCQVWNQSLWSTMKDYQQVSESIAK